MPGIHGEGYVRSRYKKTSLNRGGGSQRSMGLPLQIETAVENASSSCRAVVDRLVVSTVAPRRSNDASAMRFGALLA